MFLRKCAPLGTLARKYASEAKKLVAVNVDDTTGISTVILQRPPVNSLNLELLTELSSTLTDLENNKSRGIILTSFSDKVFSAGLDIFEMYKPQEDRMKLFWTTLQDVWIKLYGHSSPTVACINGEAPAGGCLLGMSCEYRVMIKNRKIGLNETKLGIVAPPWFIATMKNLIGHRQTELALTSGKMFTTEEAFKIGLIDEIAQDNEEAMAKSKEFFKLFKGLPFSARAMTKKLVREETIKILTKHREADLKLFHEEVSNPKAQQSLEVYLQALKQRK